jgi:hypothetical protein
MGTYRNGDERNSSDDIQLVCTMFIDWRMNLTGHYRSTEFYEIMDMLDKRLNDKGKNWRHVLKALKVLDYCLHEGSELVVTWAHKNIYIIKTLREFQYIDEDGRDVGQNGENRLKGTSGEYG